MSHEKLLQELIEHLKPVAGLKALVLGGSYAHGEARPDPDLDLGLYYQEDQPSDIAHLRAIASRIHDTANPTVTELGGWGTWVKGGAWLTIGGQRVDWLYRNLDFVSATFAACNAGQIRSDYWQQPAYGFHSYMYCTETAICRPLYDPEGVIERLKTQVAHYFPAAQAGHHLTLSLAGSLHAGEHRQTCGPERGLSGHRVPGTRYPLPGPGALRPQRNVLSQ